MPTAVHRSAAEIDTLLLRHLHATHGAVTAAELAWRIQLDRQAFQVRTRFTGWLTDVD